MTFGLISLGCDKNRVDSEHILSILTRAGHTYTDLHTADAIVINTCAFIESARSEAIETILACAEQYPQAKLIVTGCLPQKYAHEIFDSLPEVAAFVGFRDYDRLPDILAETEARRCAVDGCKMAEEAGRILTTPPHYAYLKIADGCDNRCTYCTIPSIRGPFVSRPIENIVTEAESLVRDGVRELILVAQDVTAYGRDLYGSPSLVRLLKALLPTGVETLRLMYCYPELVTDELIALIADNPQIANYIDIPIQHIADAVLKRMGRRTGGAQIRDLFNKLRARGIAVRTTVMVGFPGETQEQFDELYDFLDTYRPERVGVFAYSTEEDTPSAKLKERIPVKEKRNRVNKIGQLFLRYTQERNRSRIGQTVPVRYEDVDYERQMFRGRTEIDAPDIDCCVYFKADYADVGSVYNVTITDIDGYDLIGEVKSDHESAD